MSNPTAPPRTSVIILSPAAQAFVSQANLTIGPWIMGTFVDLLLQGILASQTVVYFALQKKRSVKSNQGPNLTWLVIGLTVLCLIKSLQNIVNVWELVVTNFCDPDVASSLSEGEWKHYTNSLSTAVIATIVQAFFVHRYWKLTGKWYICLVMMTGILLSIVSACLAVSFLAILKPSFSLGPNGSPDGPPPDGPPPDGPPPDGLSPQLWSWIHFFSAIVVDTFITVGTVWHLYSHKAGLAKPTSDMINRLIRMVWTSALPPTIFVLTNAITLQNSPSLRNTHIAINIVLPKLYAMSLMYTLNIRNEIQADREALIGVSLGVPSFTSASTHHDTSFGLLESFHPLKQ
ncbi:hypothetical protein CPB86DRAFT_764907 [Serendipita vermifera]|nr:hypothetical protein CPB86DRAFT_764907 [Serendipita vermifera]